MTFAIPNAVATARSSQHMADTFYRLPPVVENFIERFNRDAPDGWCAVPWTINRAVTIRDRTGPHAVIDYGSIEDDLVRCLDTWLEIVRGEGNANRRSG